MPKKGHFDLAELRAVRRGESQRVLELIGAGQLPAHKVGSMWIVEAQDARAFKRLPRGKAGAPRKLK